MRLGTVWLAVTLALAFVRLLSEIPGRDKRKEKRMKATRASVPNSQSGQPRKFLQYLLETIWAAGAGVLGTSLATLSQRTGGALSARAPLRYPEDEDTFFLLVEWRDLTDHTEKFRNSADFDHFVQPLRRLLREPARVHHIRTNPPTASSEEDMTAADTRLATERLE